MLEPMEIMDVADSDFLNEKHLIEDDDDSDSDSDVSRYYVFAAAAKNRLFGRKKPLHRLLGSGKAADILLWRKWRKSASILAGATIVWSVIVGMGYSLVSLICESLILLLSMMLLKTTVVSVINKSRPKLSNLVIPEKSVVNAALSLRHELNQGYRTIQCIATGREEKKFLMVSVALYGVSVMSSYFTAATTFYIISVMVLTVPVFYEKNEDAVDMLADIVLAELKRRLKKLKRKLC
ncbi:hypothetical protein L6164_029600 [Bauhinia variegata]|uniref:Uncharacterized protein n=1 Tax=Bauhinia variegata TaxID=167791 RepID=A0ACB9LB35_BAUVA|nr:hypothetical protein L6164_029600 [Bauhinia variegata]